MTNPECFSRSWPRTPEVGLLRAILDGYPGPLHAKDASGRIVFANEPMAALFLTRPEQLVGRRLRDLHGNTEEAEAALAADSRVLETGIDETLELPCTRPDGKRMLLRTVRHRILADSGEPLVLAMSTDVTEARQAERAAEETRVRWLLTVEGLHEGVWYWDIRAKTLTFSVRSKTMLGYQPHEIEDTLEAFTALVHPDDVPRMMASLQAHLTRREPYEIELRVRHKSGDWRLIHSRGVAWWNEQGRPLYMSGSQMDITQERAAISELRDANAFLAAIQEHIPLGLTVKSMAGASRDQFVVWNAGSERIAGLRAADVLGRTAHQLLPKKVADEMVRTDRAACEQRLPIEVPCFGITSVVDGCERAIRMLKVPMFGPDGDVRWMLAITEDVTARQRAEQERESALERAQAASLVKSRFLANMSHEIRTPMNGVLGLISLALDGELPNETRDLLASAQASADHLLCIINDILDLSKIEAGRVVLEAIPFSLRDLVRDSVLIVAPKAEEKGLALVVDVAPDVPDDVRGDPVRVRQILTNLVGNALKFTEAGEVRVVVSLELGAPSGIEPRVVLAVADTGIGITPDKLATLFTPFVQADGETTRRFGGTGLGLAICRELARQMGGDTTARSVLGSGSCFEAIVPLPPNAPIEEPPLRDVGILLAGGPGAGGEATARALRGMGARVLDIGDGSDEVAIGAWRPRLAIVDARATLSLATLQATLARSTPEAVPVIYLAPSRGADLSLEEGAGVSCTLRKPATSNDLRRAIQRVLASPIVAQRPSVAPAAASVDGMRILLAEDNAINTVVATKMLQRMGCVVVHAVNGRVALAHFQGGRFDAVLLDVHMPEMDGLACARAIRAAEAPGEHIPIIALTASAMAGDDTQCFDAGMDRFLTKPIDLAKLRAELVLVRGAEARRDRPERRLT